MWYDLDLIMRQNINDAMQHKHAIYGHVLNTVEFGELPIIVDETRTPIVEKLAKET